MLNGDGPPTDSVCRGGGVKHPMRLVLHHAAAVFDEIPWPHFSPVAVLGCFAPFHSAQHDTRDTSLAKGMSTLVLL